MATLRKRTNPRRARRLVLFTTASSWCSALLFSTPVFGAAALPVAESSPRPEKEDRTSPSLASEGWREDRYPLSSIPVVDIGPLLLTEQGGDGGDTEPSSSPENGIAEVRMEENPLVQKMAREINLALSSVGFMYVKNHGVSEELVQDSLDESRKFFGLPEEAKRKLSIAGSGEALHGWTDFFGENTDPERTRDYKEVYDLGRNASDDRIRPFFGPTPWPDLDVAPRFRDVLTLYHDEMLSLSRRIMKGLALSLDLPGDYFESNMKEPVGIMRLLHYPSQDSIGSSDNNDSGERGGEGDLETIGIGAHTDYGCIAILAQDDIGGLQVMNRATSRWIDAPPIPGTFVINIGDMIQRLTNDVYVANLHRVINTGGKERYSMPFFFDVDFDTVWEPLGQFVTEDRPARYPPTRCGEHKWERYKASYPHLNDTASSTPDVLPEASSESELSFA